MKSLKTGAEIVWECLLREGVEVVFGYPGGNILPTYDALNQYRDRIRHVLTRHEQGATHMADGYARASGKVGVAMATSGPGATNMVTGIATAMMDSSPIVCITGQVPSAVLGSDAFQETDITGVTVPITKHNYLVTDIEDLVDTIREAFYVARTGRPGPVLVDICKDVQNAKIKFEYPTDPIELPGPDLPVQSPADEVAAALHLINQAQCPLILAGRGVLLSGAMAELKELAEGGHIPVTTTLLGLGSFPASHPFNLGMMGMHGHAWCNFAIQEADLLIACGMRFDDRVTSKLATFAPRAKKIHIDLDAAEIHKCVEVDLGLQGDLRAVLQQLNPGLQNGVDRSAWWAKIRNWQEEADDQAVLDAERPVPLAAQVIRKIWEGTEGQAYIVTDVGQHQMFAAQYYHHDDPYSRATSGGLGTMGFGLPAAIGTSFHVKDREIWAIIGNGGIQMTINELATAVQERANINICIINNGYLGMVRQWQQMFYDSRYVQTPITGPDFVKVAEAYGMPGYRVDKLADVIPTMRKAQAYQGPVLIEFVVESIDNVYPLVPAGADLHQMIQRPQPQVTVS